MVREVWGVSKITKRVFLDGEERNRIEFWNF